MAKTDGPHDKIVILGPEKACERALLYQATSYRLICTILEKELDRLPADAYSVSPQEERIILHENLRGALAYQ